MPVINDAEDFFGYKQDDQTLIVTRNGSIASLGSTVVSAGYVGLGLLNDGYIAGYIGFNSDGTSSILNDVDGRISGAFQGVRILANSSRVANLGSITADSSEAVHVEGAGTHIQNSGTIAGVIGLYLNVEGAGGAVVNSGLIEGDDVAFYKEGGGTLSFRNSGTIDGDLTLIDGINRIDSRNGIVTGEIKGGTGTDTILAGSDGETLGGGTGHDRLVGGAAADTFVFSSYSRADSDVVKGFDVSNDTLQFDSAVFKHLGVDETPAFAIGTKASSATDVLFYNAGTGNLYYDVDGSKTAHDPFLVANLGTGLHLTANNFSVV